MPLLTYFTRLIIALCLVQTTLAEPITIAIKTGSGDINLTLYPEKAPITVNNFLRYVDAGLYKNSRFYRAVTADNQQQNTIKIEVIQGGFDSDSSKKPFAPIAHETTKMTGILHRDGVISMARNEPGSASTEFFICINDQPELDFGGHRNPDGMGFAAFGEVTSGMNIVRQIQHAKAKDGAEGNAYTRGQILQTPVTILDIVRIKQGDPDKPKERDTSI